MQPSGGGAPGGGEEEAAALASGGAASGGAEARASRGGMQPPCGGVPGGGGEEAAAPASGGAASGGAEARAEEEAAAPGRACFVPPASGGKIAHWTWHAEGEASAAHVPGATSLPAAWVRQGAGMPPALMVDCVRALSVACGGVGVGYDQRVVDRLQGRNKQDVALKRHTYLLAAVRWRPNDIAPGADGYEWVRVVTVDKLAAMMTLLKSDIQRGFYRAPPRRGNQSQYMASEAADAAIFSGRVQAWVHDTGDQLQPIARDASRVRHALVNYAVKARDFLKGKMSAFAQAST